MGSLQGTEQEGGEGEDRGQGTGRARWYEVTEWNRLFTPFTTPSRWMMQLLLHCSVRCIQVGASSGELRH